MMCPKCPVLLEQDGSHRKEFALLELISLENYPELKCGGCGYRATFALAKSQLGKWYRMNCTNALFCPMCSHQLELDKSK